MIVITGLRRSGTSMMMLALKEAGLEIEGNKFNSNRIEENPNGYWELPKICTETGLTYNLGGDVVKVMFDCLSFSDKTLIDKTIVMFRNPRNMLYSMLKGNKIDYKDIFIIKLLIDTIDSLEYLQDIDHKIVFYEDVIVDPLKEMKSIFKFLKKRGYKKGAKIVDNKLNRSPEVKETYKNFETLEKIYSLAKQGRISEIIDMKKPIEYESLMLLKKHDEA